MSLYKKGVLLAVLVCVVSSLHLTEELSAETADEIDMLIQENGGKAIIMFYGSMDEQVNSILTTAQQYSMKTGVVLIKVKANKARELT